MATFIAELRQLSKFCKYGDMLNDMVCDLFSGWHLTAEYSVMTDG